MVGGEHFVAWTKPECPRHDIEPCSGIGDEDEIVRVRSHVLTESAPRLRHQAGESPTQELDRLRFQLSLPPLVLLEHGLRARSERAVIQVANVRSQEKLRIQAVDALVRRTSGGFRTSR